MNNKNNITKKMIIHIYKLKPGNLQILENKTKTLKAPRGSSSLSSRSSSSSLPLSQKSEKWTKLYLWYYYQIRSLWMSGLYIADKNTRWFHKKNGLICALFDQSFRGLIYSFIVSNIVSNIVLVNMYIWSIIYIENSAAFSSHFKMLNKSA